MNIKLYETKKEVLCTQQEIKTELELLLVDEIQKQTTRIQNLHEMVRQEPHRKREKQELKDVREERLDMLHKLNQTASPNVIFKGVSDTELIYVVKSPHLESPLYRVTVDITGEE